LYWISKVIPFLPFHTNQLEKKKKDAIKKMVEKKKKKKSLGGIFFLKYSSMVLDLYKVPYQDFTSIEYI